MCVPCSAQVADCAKSTLAREPMFCVELAIKLLYFSNYAYGFKQVNAGIILGFNRHSH